MLPEFDKPRFTDIASKVAKTPLGVLCRKDNIVLESGDEHPWRHTVASFAVLESELKLPEKDKTARILDLRRAALKSLLELMANNFRFVSGGNDPSGWQLVVLRGGWLKETVVEKCCSNETKNVDLVDAGPVNEDMATCSVFIDSTYYFRRKP